jgi:sugar phosphate isomerase/epimerase
MAFLDPAKDDEPMAFELCLNTSTIKPVPLIDKFRLAREAGFSAIEPWINDVYEYIGLGGEVRDVERAIADNGLRVPCVIALRGWGEAVDDEYPIMLDECRRRMALGARLGASCIVATPPRVPCDLNRLTDRFGDLLEIGRGTGIEPVMEYISFFKSVWRLEQAWQIVCAARQANARLVVDAFHSWNSGSSLDELRGIPGGRIAHYHVNDAATGKPPGKQTDPDRVLPGDGPIDLRAEIGALRDGGYQGAMSLELFNADLWSQEPAQVLGLGVQRLRQLIES